MIVLAGQPGAGKGTQAARLSEAMGLQWVSAGGLARQASQNDSNIQTELQHGHLIEFSTMTRLLENVLPSNHIHTLLEGAPREIEQAEWLLNWLAAHTQSSSIVIELVISEEVSLQRSSERHRRDDTLETIKTRIEQYHNQTKPALNRLAEVLPYFAIDGTQTVEAVYRNLITIITDNTKVEA